VEDARIPARYTCSGENISPPLSWGRLPGGTRSLALLVEDPDAPGGTFVHWTVWDLSARSGGLRDGRVPDGASQGTNSFGHTRYDGPCPPKGDQPHHYRFLLYALREPLGLDAGAKPEDVQQAIAGGALASGQLIGRFGR
jgi:Raf kinase inhibitor-like YbhB/YbcL family protein